MNTNQLKSFLLFIAAFYSFLFLPLMPVWAQDFDFVDGDLRAPTIQHEPDTSPVLSGDPLTLKAIVSDNTGIEKVTLFYRRAGETKHASLTMIIFGDGHYSVTIPGWEVPGQRWSTTSKLQTRPTIYLCAVSRIH